MADRNEDYISQDQLYTALVESKEGGQPAVSLCECIRHMANIQSKHPNFIRYPDAMKEDMKSYALVKCLKNLHNIDITRTKAACWNYIYTCIRCAFIEVVGKEYKQRNIARDLAEEMMTKAKSEIPTFTNIDKRNDY